MLDTTADPSQPPVNSLITNLKRLLRGVRVTLVFTMWFGLHAYLWWRLALVLNTRQQQQSGWLLMGLASVVPLAFFLRHSSDSRALWRKIILGLGYGWLGLWFLWLSFVALIDLGGSLATRLFGWQLSTGSAAVLGGGAAMVAALAAFGVARRGPVVKNINVKLKRWPKALHGLRVVQISDLHISAFVPGHYVEKIVAQCNALKPDLIVLTGDIVDGRFDELEQDAEPLQRLSAPLGVFMVTGNHEYYYGVSAWLQKFRQLGLRVLRNEHVSLAGEHGFDLAGIDDCTAHHFMQDHGADLDKALQERAAKRPVVLLCHQPKMAAAAASAGVDLMLCGHTHGGQIWPFHYLVRLAQPYLAGLYRRANTSIYVHSGTGFWGPCMRLGSLGEITQLHLLCSD